MRQNLAENHLELAMIKSELAQVRCEFDQKQDELSARRGILFQLEPINSLSSSDQASHATEESESVRKQLQLLL